MSGRADPVITLARLAVGLGLSILLLAYVAICLHVGNPWPWRLPVHEDGVRTLLDTLFYYEHATRELPQDLLLGAGIGACVYAAFPAVKGVSRPSLPAPAVTLVVAVILIGALIQTGPTARFGIIGSSAGLTDLYSVLERVADTPTTVLITGESGTGKELIARAIHRLSQRKDAAFIKVNCAAIPTELIESELFGYEKGAFTGAAGRKKGLFEQADGGTLFLDEIGDMSLDAQAKVLRALQSGEITRVGSEQTVTVDVRVIAATNRDLEQAVTDGKFREDLYFRLSVVPLRSPALRERREDVTGLAMSFARAFATENGIKEKQVDVEVWGALSHRSWPGNVRELRNVVERMVILSGDRVTLEDLPAEGRIREAVSIHDAHDPHEASNGLRAHHEELAQHTNGGQRMTLREFRDKAEADYVVSTLKACEWNISRAAVVLGVERTNLHKKMRSLGIRRDLVPDE